ncbi:uncharacterized protein LOC117167669 isoform X2 [Belonocnema kinseyi]|uniref:uncharacterized protein LOC117167669 isoform X2 n=1 Tax=Belonocnema kinseyi TaxID=2817044 RepID=UPI00143DB959|nr:uncharacterized protein LOC117167669 isoform X2 [Belonocnema kinseyi]
MKFRTRLKSVFLMLSLISITSSSSFEKEAARTDTLDFTSGTFIFGKLLLIPFLATIGLKFLALLPVMLSKIALLGIMNFIASNLNLLLSVVLGLKNSFMKNRWSWYEQDTPQFEISPIETAPSTTKFDFLLDSHSAKGSKVFRVIPSGDAGISNFLNLNKREKTYHYIVDPKITKKVQAPSIVKPSLKNKKYYCHLTDRDSKEGGKYKCLWIDISQTQLKRKIVALPLDSAMQNYEETRFPVYFGSVSDLSSRKEEKNVTNSILSSLPGGMNG